MTRLRILFVTDLAYEARGRRYGDEDVDLTRRLREHVDLALCHPRDAAALMDAFDVVVVRNSGPVLGYQAAHDAFRDRALATGMPVFTELTGRGDQAGKQYLLELGAAGYPVIPTVSSPTDLDRLPVVDEYAVKPRLGADSHGLRFLSAAEVRALADDDLLIQPRIPFAYEVSFYFVDDRFQYALYAPDPTQRWELAPYSATPDDLAFADRFIAWNPIRHGIQRVDACRAPSGELMLVELEDLNPYLSLHLVTEAQRVAFVAAMVASITGLARG
ncbi:hypothetical protein [Pseudolysinimonas sp.]|jgi:hypothetical protein|uniref:hypothetical protein n=1 Tax=Pseudolysinimonas sp. TaxID=2680009 RepID=UPI003784766B